MGEEEQKPEEKKVEEEKAKEKKPEEAKNDGVSEEEKKEQSKPEEKKNDNEEGKDEKLPPPPPPPPQEIVLKVYMHCEGCARKVRRCLKGFQGVEDVETNCKSHIVVVKGEKADPLKVLERVQRKSHRQVELLSPLPKPPSEEHKKPVEEEKPKPEDKIEETPIVTVVLKVYMHCEACAHEIEKRILRMKGVESAEADLKSSQVTVKGALDSAKLVDYVHKRTGKKAVIVNQNPEKADGAGKAKDEAKKEGDEKKSEEAGEKKGEGDGEAEAEGKEEKVEESSTVQVEMKRSEYSYYPPRYAMEMYAYNAYDAPQMFSDENPNACSVM